MTMAHSSTSTYRWIIAASEIIGAPPLINADSYVLVKMDH